MDKESILRLGLDFIRNIDLNQSDELYNPSTNNHIIKLKLYKDDHMYCPHYGLINSFNPRGVNSKIRVTKRVCGHFFRLIL